MRRNMEETEVIFKSQTRPRIPYRIYQISKDGIYLGGNFIKGRFPWRNAQSVARGIIRAWARDLVVGHNTTQLATIFHRWARDWSSDNDGADTNNGEVPPLENILSSLIDRRLEHKAYFRQAYDSRDGSVLSHLSEEMIKAVGYCLKRISMKPGTEWMFQEPPVPNQDLDSICAWLFERR